LKRVLPLFFTLLIVKSGWSLDYNPRINYLSNPFFYKRKGESGKRGRSKQSLAQILKPNWEKNWKPKRIKPTPAQFRFYYYTPYIPKKFVGKVVDSGDGLYTLYSMLGGVYHLNSALLSLLYRYNHYSLYTRRFVSRKFSSNTKISSTKKSPRFEELENFLAYLQLKLWSGLRQIRYFKNRQAIWQNSLYLAGKVLSLYLRGSYLLKIGKRRKGMEIGVDLCRRELYWLRILASNKICTCADFLMESYTQLWYRCRKLEQKIALIPKIVPKKKSKRFFKRSRKIKKPYSKNSKSHHFRKGRKGKKGKNRTKK